MYEGRGVRETGSAAGQEDADALPVCEITREGSLGTLYYGDRRTTVQDRKRELPTGTFHAMLRQLGITTETFSEE